MASQGPVDPDAYTTPFMLTKKMHRDVYHAVDPMVNPTVEAEGKVILVTGATGGVGFVSLAVSIICPVRRWAATARVLTWGAQAVARSFLSAGAKGVVLVARTFEKLQLAARELNADGKAMPIAANTIQQVETDNVLKQAMERFGQVDVLVNASGTMDLGLIGTISPIDWWRNFVRLLQTPRNVQMLTRVLSLGG